MIRIRVKRDHENRMERIRITGHAEYDQSGKDIVCAAVSGISIGMVNAIEQMFDVQVHASDDGNGKIDCQLPDRLSSEKQASIRLLLEAMFLSLQNVADEFPSYVKISEW
ncbi:ribosomal-processing cysteine protease Prp [Hazenella sp. IB182357]|uniref:Ribosomal processing cysteine protease Prp n=1 Tax=Polycladospora coralii TaxID=2771432 RepID=A0A926NDW2_9BACL|nr:ribosomal-processing cysteine protease Prp [Polycladospora coralii]MBD1371769.1 ribosomal-processing cysteine protease Prp [Polycladospora coralii]MBS7529230.1 ribosomal-processing cysteine protease Prp [Polycladospora coralii]